MSCKNENEKHIDFHLDSYLLGMEDAIKQILQEYELCKEEYDETKPLNIVKLGFSRAIGLIEDEMLQTKFKESEAWKHICINYYCNKLEKL
jgi:hypothetical protein